MKSTRRLIVPVLAVAVLGVAAPAFAVDNGGGSAGITATLSPTNLGERSVTSVSPVALVPSATLGVATGALSVLVTETARGGTNGWSVTAVASDLTSGSDTITKSNLAVSGRSVVQALGGGTSSAPTGSSSLASAATLFSNSGQNTSALYTGTYTGASTVSLTVPNGAAAGAYTGTLTVSLV